MIENESASAIIMRNLIKDTNCSNIMAFILKQVVDVPQYNCKA